MKHRFLGQLNLFLLLSAFALAAGCSDQSEQAEGDVVMVDTTAQSGQEELEKVFYQVPGPNEMFAFIKESSSSAKNTTMLNNPDNYTKYNDLNTKAINFGIYSTDLLYCSTFDLGPEVMKYFAVVKKMSDDLGISSAITESDMQRIESSIGETDSLTSVANEIYYNTYQTLEQNDQGKVLAQMVAGGWLESLYLVTGMNPEYKEDNVVFQRIADQKLTLENLVNYLKKYEDDSGISNTINKLTELQEIYNGFSVGTEGKTQVENKGGKMVLSGGSTITMSPEQYKALSAKVAEIRNSFTGVN